MVLVCNPSTTPLLFRDGPCFHSWQSEHNLFTDPSQGTVHLEVQGHFPLHPLIFIKNVTQKHHHKFCPLCPCSKWLSQQICRVIMCVHTGYPPFITWCPSLKKWHAIRCDFFLRVESGMEAFAETEWLSPWMKAGPSTGVPIILSLCLSPLRHSAHCFMALNAD